jgi:hypothetical protein
MMRRVSIAALVWFVVGCTDAEPETAIAEQGLAACSCESPTATPWVAGRTAPSRLFPTGVVHLHTFLADADTSFYAWGIAKGEVLWLYRVGDADAGDFLSTLNQAWIEAEGPGMSHSIAGSLKGSPPPPPTPPGEPEFSQAYVQRVLASAQQHEDATELALAKLGAM